MEQTEALSGVLEKHAWSFQHLCEDYVELERIARSPLSKKYPRELTFSGIPPERAAEDAAVAERLRLGLGDGPIQNLRDTLEQEVGLRVFFLLLPSDVSAMFSYDESMGGCIAVNASHSNARRRLSLAHEYAHFLASRRQASVDLARRYHRVPVQERFATVFAPAFLMPTSGISRRFNEIKSANGGRVTYAELLALANYFGVSLEALTRRLEQLRLINRGTWERVKESGFRSEEGKALLKLVETPAAADLIPTRYFVLAVQVYRQGLITEGQFARFLRVDLHEARRVLTDVLGSAPSEAVPPIIGETDIDRAKGK
jgi:Zn-dependent peptidase ImmA (M78 family)